MLTPMSPHQEYELAVAAYALDALDAVDRPALEAHLTTCARCRAELADMRRASVALALGAAPVAAPEGLKQRVLARVTADRQPPVTPRRRSTDRPADATSRTAMPGWLAVAAALLLAAASGAYAVWVRGEVHALRETVARSSVRDTEIDRLIGEMRRQAANVSQTLDVLSAPDLVRVDLAGQPGSTTAAGRAFWSRSRGVLFTAQGLSALPANRVYQLWVVTPTAPVSAGLLTVSATGTTTIFSTLPADLSSLVAVAVTIEPAGGVSSPTGPKVLIGAL